MSRLPTWVSPCILENDQFCRRHPGGDCRSSSRSSHGHALAASPAVADEEAEPAASLVTEHALAPVLESLASPTTCRHLLPRCGAYLAVCAGAPALRGQRVSQVVPARVAATATRWSTPWSEIHNPMISRAAGNSGIPRPHGSLLTPVAPQERRMSWLPVGGPSILETTSCCGRHPVETVDVQAEQPRSDAPC